MEEGARAAGQEELCQQLSTVDKSLRFLVLIILSVLLSFYSVLIQRRGLVCTIEGDTQAAGALPKVFPIKITAGALVIAALGFFLCLALQTCKAAAQGGDPVAQKSASTNVLASLLVFAAALLRFDDLNFVESSQSQLLAQDDLPA